jgi:hypothetical protein
MLGTFIRRSQEYGSNTLEERFLCYIKGGRFRLEGNRMDGGRYKTPLVDTNEYFAPFGMYE